MHTWSHKAFTGTVVNQTLPSLNGESIEITLKVPLRTWMVTKKTRIYINNNIEFTHLRCFRPGHTLNTHSTKQYNKIIGMGTAN